MTTIQLILAMLLPATATSAAACQSTIGESVAESHIRANLPDEEDFQKFLKRDLELYFTEAETKDLVIEYQFLCGGPTQTGIAFAKFYAWVKIKEDDRLLEEGIVRVAAMENKRFGFLST